MGKIVPDTEHFMVRRVQVATIITRASRVGYLADPCTCAVEIERGFT